MGGFLSPKAPAPAPLPPPPKVDDEVLNQERVARQAKAGRQGTIVSSLVDQVEDKKVETRISKLLG